MRPPLVSPKYQFVIGWTSAVLTRYLCNGQPLFVFSSTISTKKKDVGISHANISQIHGLSMTDKTCQACTYNNALFF